MVEGLIEVAVQLFAARAAFARASVTLPCTLWTVSAQGVARPCFVGLMPMPRPQSAQEPEGHALLERELVPHLRVMRRTRVDFSAVQHELATRAEVAPRDGAARRLSEVARALES